jgi:hypothetical protein
MDNGAPLAPARQQVFVWGKSLSLIAFSEPPSNATWLENAQRPEIPR